MNRLIEERLRLANEVEKISGMSLEKIRALLAAGAEFKVSSNPEDAKLTRYERCKRLK